NPDATPTIRDLAKHRWPGQPLSRVQERDLIARAQAGDQYAGWELLGSFLQWIKGRPKLKGNIGYGARLFDDCIGAGLLAAWKCVLSFDHSEGSRFNTHMRLPVAGAISDEKVAFRMRGAAGATRLEKYILHHWNHSPEWILNDIKKL